MGDGVPRLEVMSMGVHSAFDLIGTHYYAIGPSLQPREPQSKRYFAPAVTAARPKQGRVGPRVRMWVPIL